MQPTKGRIVMARHIDGKTYAAVVVGVHAISPVVDLYIFPNRDSDTGYLLLSVTHWEPTAGEKPSGTTWHWPPRVQDGATR